jgi:parallel beta-helix repeat protein
MLLCTLTVSLGILLSVGWFHYQGVHPVSAAPLGVNRYVATSGSNAGGNTCTNSGNPCRTIQYAINISTNGDNIYVVPQATPQIFYEYLTMKDGVSVYGQNWDHTIIHGGYTGISTVYFPSSVSASTVLSGVQVTGGGLGYIGMNPDGGGLRIYGSPTIVNTWVYSNTGGAGGGVYVNGGLPTFNNVPVWNNRADYGGGFYIVNNAVVTLYGNPFEGTNGTVLTNSAEGGGGGFYIHNASVTMAGLRVYWNSAEQGGGLYIKDTNQKINLWLNDISGNTTSLTGGGGLYINDVTDLDMFANSIGNRISSVSGNISQGDGGGIFFLQSAGNVHSNWFYDNKANGLGSGGAAAFCYTTTNLVVTGNWIEGNVAQGDGGGFSLFGGANPQIDANTIVSNTANQGGGMDLTDSGIAKITNNIIARNIATLIPIEGGGINLEQSPAQIINNTIASNVAYGIRFVQSNGIVIVNNILYRNVIAIDGDVASNGTTSYALDYNDFFDNSTNGIPAGAHDLHLEPVIKATGDMFQYYHLHILSPLKTTGSTAWAPDHDIDNQARPSGGVSMGADQLPEIFLPLILR